jgi:hydrogenase expression/formation protein HypE
MNTLSFEEDTMVPERHSFPPGKLPTRVLARLLDRYVAEDQRLIIGPRVGMDAAAIEMDDRVLVVKSDPITFPTDDVGRYLVVVNANDIACLGADPRWLLVTALLPEKDTTEELVESLFAGVAEAAQELGISLVGGHTEITLGIDRPILIGQMLGETTKDRLLDLRNAQSGDAVILCNGIAIEGTAILANEIDTSEFVSIDPTVIKRARNFSRIPGISVVQAARSLASLGSNLRGLHDPTEGGLATALEELTLATGRAAEIYASRILVYDETSLICEILGLDPLGLIASGALLAVVAPEAADGALQLLSAAGVRGAMIGRLLDNSDQNYIIDNEICKPLPTFQNDEIARFFASR